MKEIWNGSIQRNSEFLILKKFIHTVANKTPDLHSRNPLKTPCLSVWDRDPCNLQNVNKIHGKNRSKPKCVV